MEAWNAKASAPGFSASRPAQSTEGFAGAGEEPVCFLEGSMSITTIMSVFGVIFNP
jgi:hypothetical protein